VIAIEHSPPRISQVALCTPDLPSALRHFHEVLRFADAGGDVLWGEWLAQMQEIDGPVACTVWWLCSRQDLFQVELFQHTVPTPATAAADWRPSDLGWTQLGIAVPDWDGCLERVRAEGIQPLEVAPGPEGARTFSYRPPGLALMIEVFEDGPAVAGGVRPRQFDVGPAVIYVGLSVADADRAEDFFADVIGLDRLPPDAIQRDDRAGAAWAPDGVDRDLRVLDAGGIFLQISQYSKPAPRPKPENYKVYDHGFSHVAFGYRDRSDLDRLVQRLENAGCALNNPLGPPPAAAYLHAPDGTALEVLSIPQERDPEFGFAPREVNLRPASW
jgi:catechol 2,3-dioxygenase-like lactoylglutathione lyase family enzyme